MAALVQTRPDTSRPLGGGSRSRFATPTSAAIAIAVLVGAGVLSLLVGARWVPVEAVWDSTHPLHPIVEVRFERTMLGFAVGAALGLAGALMQGLTRNPLADPGILGVNAGATFAMVIGMTVFGASAMGQFLPLAFVGAAAAALLVHAIASLGRDGATPMKLAITGAALSAGLASWTTGLLLADRKTMESFRFWQVGTIGGRGFDVLLAGLPFLVVGAVLALAGARLLNTLALGEDLARGLGRRTTRDRLVIALAIVLLAGTATALAGPIAFVGLVVPHVVRTLVGPDYARVLPFSMLGGAALIVVADTIGRIVLPPSEVQVGIMAAAVGVPVFIVLVRRTGRAL
ncbi:iron complex transport system permease protein [Nocardioides alpinus]|uniref:Iron ABC transporter permease n=1 Tax=Nocardioides alpinus TaxID=748909 RepID=A0A1I0WDU7_9ACTN|nr:iron ABC transporter permease [Nocardioides alpinus]PKH37858.1 iron ABC transporter permease [Nocardioides alpinus]SFA86754.1 iron complex transport system permease protein [Nocardioides alpinus]